MLNSINFISGLNTTVTFIFSYRDCLERAKIVAIRHHDKWVLVIFSLRMHTYGYLGDSGEKSDVVINIGDPDFL